MILVTGAAGFIGQQLVAALIDAGQPVRVLLTERRAREVQWAAAPEIITGSLSDDETLFRAMTGVHVIYHLENAQWWGRERDLEQVELEGTRELIAAARAARVGRIIIVSHLGASPSSGYMLLRAKGRLEEAIRTSGLAYTIVRSGVVFGEGDAFINHLAMQLRANPFAFFMPGRGEVVLHPIHVADLTAALVGCLTAIDTIDNVIEIGGAEYITFEDLLYTVMRVSGASRTIIGVPPYLLRALTAVYDRLLRRSLITSQWLDLLAVNRTARLGTLYEVFGVRARRLEDALMAYMPRRRYGLEMLRYTLKRRPNRRDYA